MSNVQSGSSSSVGLFLSLEQEGDEGGAARGAVARLAQERGASGPCCKGMRAQASLRAARRARGYSLVRAGDVAQKRRRRGSDTRIVGCWDYCTAARRYCWESWVL